MSSTKNRTILGELSRSDAAFRLMDEVDSPSKHRVIRSRVALDVIDQTLGQAWPGIQCAIGVNL